MIGEASFTGVVSFRVKVFTGFSVIGLGSCISLFIVRLCGVCTDESDETFFALAVTDDATDAAMSA